MHDSKQSRLTPQHPHWHEDLPDIGAPDEAALEIAGDLNHLDEIYLEISRASSKLRGVMIFFGLLALVMMVFLVRIFFLPRFFDEVDWFTFFLPIAIFSFFALTIDGFRLDTAIPRDEPVRFNRKRGKVYVYEFKHTWNPFAHWGAVTREFDWQNLRAEITREAGYNGKVYMVRYALVLSSVKPGTNEVIDRFVLKGNEVVTYALRTTWAYCKRYMDGGPDALPATGLRERQISLKRSFFEYLPHLDPSEAGRLERKKMHWLEWIIVIIIIPVYPLLAVIGLCHYIAMRFAPEPAWPEDMAAESSTAPEAKPA